MKEECVRLDCKVNHSSLVLTAGRYFIHPSSLFRFNNILFVHAFGIKKFFMSGVTLYIARYIA
uniref:Uncharacterized protein n=1 Tax=Anguilla anguilla TaxID=7936 RepID=A0A0E9UD25_ANGAN